MTTSDAIRILYVDNDSDIAETVMTSLEMEDDRFTVVAAQDASEGRDKLSDGDFDCVVSDYEMPSENGIEFLESVRGDYSDLPFILYTGKGSEEVASEAISAGVTEYMQKGTGTDQYAVLANRIENSVDQYRSTRKVEKTQRRLEELAESTGDCRWMFDSEWDELLFISGYEEVWDRPVETIKNDPLDFLEGVHPEDREDVKRAMNRISAGEALDIEYRILRGDDTVGWAWAKGEPIYDVDDGDVVRVAGLTRDITERKEREQELREKSNLLDEIFTQVPTHLYVKDEQARHIRVSEYHIEREPHLGDPEEFIGKTDEEVLGEVGKETYAEDLQVIETGQPLINKEEYVPAEDKWNLTSKVPWYDENGEIAGLIGVSRWITKRKEYEQQLERQNERLDEFAAILSHDLRNPLNVAQGRIELIEREYTSENLDAVVRALERMDTLIDEILTLARQGVGAMDITTLSLAELCRRCWQNVETGEATLVVETDQTIRADRSKAKRLLENLIRNAIEHGGPAVEVTVGNLAEGLYFEDDGSGIPEDEHDHVFESGYSTTTEGTGFGLSIVAEVAKTHGWNIDVTDSEDCGARFEITGVTSQP